MYYSLPKLAAKYGISEKTLRGWRGKGWLVASAKTANGQGRYTDRDFERARLRSVEVEAPQARAKVRRRRGFAAQNMGLAPDGWAQKLSQEIRRRGRTAAARNKRLTAA